VSQEGIGHTNRGRKERKGEAPLCVWAKDQTEANEQINIAPLYTILTLSSQSLLTHTHT